MPATTVHLGFGLLVLAALLPRDRFDRALLGVFATVLVFPDLDSIVGWWLPGAHRAMFHTFVLAAIVAGAIYYDSEVRETSWLRERGGARAVRVAWALLATNLLAHVLLDWAHLSGINLFYPVSDQFYRLEGELAYSTADGWIQTFVDIESEAEGDGGRIDVGQQGTTEDVHVSTPTDPEPGGGVDEDVERIAPFAIHGWQLYLGLVGLFAVGARRLQGEAPERATEE